MSRASEPASPDKPRYGDAPPERRFVFLVSQVKRHGERSQRSGVLPAGKKSIYPIRITCVRGENNPQVLLFQFDSGQIDEEKYQCKQYRQPGIMRSNDKTKRRD
jgi:hypothetical protein